jgi:hypothetical protein
MIASLPNEASLDLIAETLDVHHVLKACADLIGHGCDQKYYSTVPEWRSLMGEGQCRCIQAQVPEFEEEGQASARIKMGILAIWEADQAMRDGVANRDHPTGFPA